MKLDAGTGSTRPRFRGTAAVENTSRTRSRFEFARLPRWSPDLGGPRSHVISLARSDGRPARCPQRWRPEQPANRAGALLCAMQFSVTSFAIVAVATSIVTTSLRALCSSDRPDVDRERAEPGTRRDFCERHRRPAPGEEPLLQTARARCSALCNSASRRLRSVATSLVTASLRVLCSSERPT